ncbi:MAG: hypothetical protein OEU95_00100 [Nitrospirota bacterium]|nr:hypothetical protein [Nitrospirota bacterium]
MEATGYPGFILYLILLFGIPLALTRPFRAFLLVTFILAAANSKAFTFTRTDLLGPYFNAHDACLLVALAGISPYILFQIKKIQVPDITKWIIAVLLIGFVQSWFVMGGTYETLRALRWAINLPVYFIIAATMVDNNKKVRYLLLALFLGSIVSAVEHIVFVRSAIEHSRFSINNVGEFRTIAYRSPGIWFLLASLVWLPKFRGIDRKLLFGAGILFAISVVLNQTRSIWISSIAALPASFLLFKNRMKNIRTILIPLMFIVITASAMFLLPHITREIDPINIITERLETFSDPDIRYLTTITRISALEREIDAWSSGTLILGRGLAYFMPLHAPNDHIAWGHLGHVTTLAQLGLVGFAIYSIYLPFTVVTACRKLWRHNSYEIKYFGLLAGTTMIASWICFLMSDSFLAQHATEGIIFGAAWRQARLMGTDKEFMKQTSILRTVLIYRANS